MHTYAYPDSRQMNTELLSGDFGRVEKVGTEEPKWEECHEEEQEEDCHITGAPRHVDLRDACSQSNYGDGHASCGKDEQGPTTDTIDGKEGEDCCEDLPRQYACCQQRR